MFKRGILVGHSENVVEEIIEHLEKSNIPFELKIKDILKQSSEEYEALFMVKVQRKFAKQVEAIVAQYVSQEDLKHWYKVAKRKSRKLERKKRVLYLFLAFIYILALMIIEMGKAEGANIVSAIICAVILVGSIYITVKYFRSMKKESGVLRESNLVIMFLGISMIMYSVTSLISVFPFS